MQRSAIIAQWAGTSSIFATKRGSMIETQPTLMPRVRAASHKAVYRHRGRIAQHFGHGDGAQVMAGLRFVVGHHRHHLRRLSQPVQLQRQVPLAPVPVGYLVRRRRALRIDMIGKLGPQRWDEMRTKRQG